MLKHSSQRTNEKKLHSTLAVSWCVTVCIYYGRTFLLGCHLPFIGLFFKRSLVAHWVYLAVWPEDDDLFGLGVKYGPLIEDIRVKNNSNSRRRASNIINTSLRDDGGLCVRVSGNAREMCSPTTRGNGGDHSLTNYPPTLSISPLPPFLLIVQGYSSIQRHSTKSSIQVQRFNLLFFNTPTPPIQNDTQKCQFPLVLLEFSG